MTADHLDEIGLRFSPTSPEGSIDAVRALLGFLRRRLDLDVAWLSPFHDDDLIFEVLDGDAAALGLSAGDRIGLSGSYCIRVVDGRLPAVIPDTAANQTTRELTVTRDLGLGAYVGVPVQDNDGTVVGSLCVVSQRPKPYLGDVDMRIVKLVADLVGALVAELPAREPKPAGDRRSAIRQVVADGNFELLFQAIHDIATGDVVGVEALVRFPCEPFQPDVFFEEAAALGLGVELEIAVVDRVFAYLPALPPDVFVAVNISPGAALVAPWSDLLAGVDAARIVLEITEHAAVENYAALDDVLEECRARGLRVAVDDVGSGFSSFTHVLELSPDFVKIDRAITRNIHIDDARRSLTHAIVEFSEQMGATVIAEGVETQDELDAVGGAGVFWAQGYHLSRPKAVTHGFPSADATTTPTDRKGTAPDLFGKRRFDLALAHSPIGMAVVGLDGTFVRTNRALSAMLGYGRRELAALTFQDLTHPDDLHADLELFDKCLTGRRRSYRMVKRFIAADGRIVWGDLTVVLVRGPRDQARCFVSQILDVTADRVREAELAHQAATDPLTATANRSAAWGRLEHLDACDEGYGVLFCDIERFRSVNDRRGHRAGDRLLVAVADRLCAAVSPEHVVARWGGDEFLVITGPIGERDLADLADRITAHAQETTVTVGDGTEEPVALSVGYAVHIPGDGRTVDDILEHADRAMYERRRRRTGVEHS
jgi:diguanylate cyclase (GGDEF)-like protein/PAS domain S-box-containing protein